MKKMVALLNRDLFTFGVVLLFAGLMMGCNSSTTAPIPENFSLNMQKTSGSAATGTLDESPININSVRIIMKRIVLLPAASKEPGIFQEQQLLAEGPITINLDLNGSLTNIALKNITPAVYYGMKFEISGLLQRYARRFNGISPFSNTAFPDSGCSVIVKGTYLGSPFIFKTNQTFEERAFFSSPITVTKDGFITTTLSIDPYSWFKKDNSYLNPNNYQNSVEINRLIKNSFNRVFKINNKNNNTGIL